MLKNYLIFYPILAIAFGHNCQAASIYNFSGQISSVTDSAGNFVSTYTRDGLFTGAAVNFAISLDAGKNGTSTAPNGAVTSYPFYQHTSTTGSQDSWYRYAALISSSIDMSSSSVGPTGNLLMDLSYLASNTSFYEGDIGVGSELSIYKSLKYGDATAFVENWKVGDSLAFFIDFNDGSGEAIARGDLKLVNISTPLPAISTIGAVPIPGSASLFGSILIGLFGVARKVKAA